MNKNIILNTTREKEIDKILQDGIDKSLLYLKTLNTTKLHNTIQYRNMTFNKRNYMSINNSNYNRNIPLKENNTHPIQIKKFNTLSIRPKSSSIYKKKKLKKKVHDYQVEYNKKKDELEEYKKQLVQERIRQNKLLKEMNAKSKKEEELKQIEENTHLLKKNSEELISKIQRSEKIREEQKKLIDELLKEYNALINELRNNPNVEIINKYSELESEAGYLKTEDNIKKVRKVKKKLSKNKIKKK